MSKSAAPLPPPTASVAIMRLAGRGFVLAYLIIVTLLGVIAALLATSVDPGPEQIAPVIAALVATAVVIGGGLWFLRRRMTRLIGALEDDRFGLQHAYDRARLDSLVDGLTGLGNLRAFQEAIAEEFARARDRRDPLALLMIDVDDLTVINERSGHAAGDEVIRATALILRTNLRRSDRPFRIGGDAFALLLPGCDLDGAAKVADNLLAAASSGIHGTYGAFTVTIGATAYPDLSAGRQEMILQADAALFSAKRHGHGTIERFDPSRHGIADDARSLPELTAAVERVAAGDQLRAVYQPIFSLSTGAVTGFEGLVRLSDDAGFPDPSSLFTAAEATRRTVELDIVCARTVLAGVGTLAPNLSITINLSPRTLGAEGFSPLEVVALARSHSIAPSQLVVELTEREEIEDMGRLQVAVATLRRHGVRVAIDDVGEGYAGLRLLTDIEVDIMKVDLSLVRAGAHAPSDAVLRTLVDIARRRGRTIVAEGIETADMLEAVLELRFDAGQGYLLGRPAPDLVWDGADLFTLIASDDSEATAAA
jgi:diguanylate cyclase (GGDEF)-like protein